MDIGAAGPGDAHFSGEGFADSGGQVDRQREQRAAGHIHFLAGQFARLHVHGEGVGQFDAELHALRAGQGGQTLQHGHGILPLEVFAEVAVVEGDVVKTQAVQALPGKVIAQEGRVQLDIGVEVFFLNQIGGDALDFVRWTAVEGGFRDGAGDTGGNTGDVRFIHVLEAVQMVPGPFDAEPEGVRILRLDQAVDEGVDFGALNARQVVAHRHVEHKGVRIAEAEFLRQQLAGHPGLDILREGLRHIQLRGPFAVIALVAGGDAGLADAPSQLRAVHGLDGFQLEEAGAGSIGGDDILGQLGVRAGGRAEGRFDFFPEDRQGAAGCVFDRISHAEEAAGFPVFFQGPGHQAAERHGPHDIAHRFSPLRSVFFMIEFAP